MLLLPFRTLLGRKSTSNVFSLILSKIIESLKKKKLGENFSFSQKHTSINRATRLFQASIKKGIREVSLCLKASMSFL